MSGQDWLTPATAPPPSFEQMTAGPAVRAPGLALRPLTLSEILDRTFAVYKSRFWLFCGISAIAGVFNLLAQVAQLILQHAGKGSAVVGARNITSLGVPVAALVAMLVFFLIFFLAYGVTQAATVYALTEVYLGRAVTIGGSLKATIGRWWAYAVVAIWQYLTVLWLPTAIIIPAFVLMTVLGPSLAWLGGLLILLVIPATVFGVILLMRNLLAIQAMVDEKLGIRASMRRSKQLAQGAKGRIFVVCLIWMALYMVVGMVQMPLGIIVVMAAAKGGQAIGAQAVMLLVGFLGHSVVVPVGLIGLSLVYFDQRVRKEAYDLELLMAELPPVAPVTPVQPPYATPAAPVDGNQTVSDERTL